MSNWFSFYHSDRQTERFKKKKPLPIHFVASIVLILTGTWFVLFILGLQGALPFGSVQVAPNRLPAEYFSPSVLYWEEDIINWAETWTLDPLLVATVMQIESCGDPYAISPAGAQGLFQVMPYHFLEGEELLEVHTNARRGMDYLSKSFIKSGGDIDRTLAGYNGGHSQISQEPNRWPSETKRYVHWGVGIYQDAKLWIDNGGSLNAWLNAGGKWLCQQAEYNLGLH